MAAMARTSSEFLPEPSQPKEICDACRLNFNRRKRCMKHAEYSYQKAKWLASHPDATPAQIEAAMKSIARKLGI